MLSIHDPTWYPGKRRHARQARNLRMMNPIAAVRAATCRYREGCFVFPGDPDEQGRCRRLVTELPYYFHYRGRNIHGAMECTMDPDCRVAVTTATGWTSPPTPDCPSGYEKGYGQVMLAAEPDKGTSRYYMVCCPKPPWKRVTAPTPLQP